MSMRYLLQQTRSYSKAARFHGRFAGKPSRDGYRLLKVSEEVAAAMDSMKPVVALESTVYTHGFPKPDNFELAKSMEKAVRDNGAVPATICVLGGKICVGLSPQQIEEMADSAGSDHVIKVSRRDLPYVLGTSFVNPGRRIVGGTTVAGTMIAARMAGIQVFATGGIGGVHAGFANHLDVSADLKELGRTNVTVIASGAKSFLDIPKTLEYLETEGVYVGTFRDKDYGPEDTVMFPAFYARSYGNLKAPSVIESPAEAAGIIHASRAMRMESGMLFSNPVPKEYEIEHSVMVDIITSATAKAEAAGVRGREVTPYILNEIRAASDGKSVRANRALLINNAVMGAKVAAELVRLKPVFNKRYPGDKARADTSEESGSSNSFIPPPDLTASPSSTPSTRPSATKSEPLQAPEVVVVGGVAVDLTCDPKAPPQLHTSNPSRISESLGGVGSNVARALHKCRVPTRLVSTVGNDVAGLWICNKLQQEGAPKLPPMDISGIKTSETHPTARYISFTDSHGGLITAAADMEIHTHQDIKTIEPHLQGSSPPKFVIVDGNLSKSTTLEILKVCHRSGIKVIFEPTSTPKSTHIIPPSVVTPPVYPAPYMFAASPNIHELSSLHSGFSDASHFSTDLPWFSIIDLLNLSSNYRDSLRLISKSVGSDLLADGTLQKAVMLLPYISKLWIKMGEKGCLIVELVSTSDAEKHEQRGFGDHDAYAEVRHKASERAAERFGIWGVKLKHYPAAEKMVEGSVVSVNGAGDTFLGVFVAGLCKGLSESEAVRSAQMGSVRTLKSRESVGDLEGLLEQ